MVNALVRQESNILDALLMVLSNHKAEILSEVVKEDIPQLMKNSVNPVANVCRSLKKTAMKTYDQSLAENISSIKKNAVSFARSVRDTPLVIYDRSKNGLFYFKKTLADFDSDIERAEFILKLATYLTSLTVGAYAGYSIPDKDISILGIGRHRSAFFHSFMMAVGVGIVVRTLLRIFDKAEMYINNDSASRELFDFIKANLKFMAFGASVGVAVHLGVDGSIEGTKAVTTPISNTFVSGTLLDDNAYLLINSIMAANTNRN